MTTEPIALIWVCQRCLFDDSHGGDGIAPWSLETGEVTMGMLAAEHADDCPVRITGEWPDNYECECERRDFSWRRCDGCGSTLGGERHAFTVWAEPADVSLPH